MLAVRDRVKIALTFSAFLSLSGCEQRAWTRDEIADIAADAAWQSVEGVEGAASQSDLEALEPRVEELETENRYLRSMVDALDNQVSENATKYNQNLDDYATHTHRTY